MICGADALPKDFRELTSAQLCPVSHIQESAEAHVHSRQAHRLFTVAIYLFGLQTNVT
jgi:hypothetical protein